MGHVTGTAHHIANAADKTHGTIKCNPNRRAHTTADHSPPALANLARFGNSKHRAVPRARKKARRRYGYRR